MAQAVSPLKPSSSRAKTVSLFLVVTCYCFLPLSFPEAELQTPRFVDTDSQHHKPSYGSPLAFFPLRFPSVRFPPRRTAYGFPLATLLENLPSYSGFYSLPPLTPIGYHWVTPPSYSPPIFSLPPSVFPAKSLKTRNRYHVPTMLHLFFFVELHFLPCFPFFIVERCPSLYPGKEVSLSALFLSFGLPGPMLATSAILTCDKRVFLDLHIPGSSPRFLNI